MRGMLLTACCVQGTRGGTLGGRLQLRGSSLATCDVTTMVQARAFSAQVEVHVSLLCTVLDHVTHEICLHYSS